ncbi:MAG: methyltransferase domain-containing protein [Verrucomicrobia bacterium]|nr:methyltransferase domain-containing protein [Verrucomicrobiota bacterium]
MNDFDEIFNVIRYDPKSADALDDAISELAAILDCGAESAGQLVKRFLDFYHYGTGPFPADVPDENVMLMIELTRPFRIPFMVAVMKPLLDRIGAIQGKDVLDYGAGSGKDSILFAKLGASVTYAELPSHTRANTAKRFKIRGFHNIEMKDVRRLDPDRRYDVVDCIDVLQLVYDVEYVLADIVARLKEGGHLLCFACFENHWDGSHIEKNCGYQPYFTDMLLSIGLEPLGPVRRDGFWITRGLKPSGLQTYHLRRVRPIRGAIEEEREIIRRELYHFSFTHSSRAMRWCATALPFAKLFRRDLATAIADNLFDNYAIRRLSKHQLETLPKVISA